jgi:hypothetical protein
MATTLLALKRSVLPNLIDPFDRASAADFVLSIFNREMGVTLHNAKVGSKRDEAMQGLTREAANLYAGRVLRELIQNAFDGAASDAEPRILLRLDLSESPYGTLFVANNGDGFAVENLNAISNPAMSNKTAGNFIGHKGLGFRSVELLCDDVQIFSKLNRHATSFDGFCFGFASEADERDWLERVGEAEFASLVVGKTHRYQLPVPIDVIDSTVEKIAADGFSTVIRLPLRDAVATERAQEEMRMLIDEKAPILLFLDRLTSLTLERIDPEGVRDTKTLSRSGKGVRGSACGRNLRLEEVSVEKHRYLVGRMDVDDEAFRASIEKAVARQYHVERWREWKGAPTVSVALALSADAQAGSIYAFLPMEAPAPFNGCLDAPFHPKADRRDLDCANPLNSFLLDAVADLCLAIARTLADEQGTSFEAASAAVDAIAWSGDAQRIADACKRAGIELGTLLLPTVRRKEVETRWAPVEEVFDWNDDAFRIIKGLWLVRACDIPMLRRNLGANRLEALRDFVGEVDLTFDPADSNWIRWAPTLANDLARRKATRQDWENFYADLASLSSALPLLKGVAIFRLDDGRIAEANSPTTIEARELFISPDPENAVRTRKRLAGTSLFPPKSIAQRMLFADPALTWSPNVTGAFFKAGLATEYSLPKVISRMGRLLGNRPSRQTAIEAVNWAFSAWKLHKSPEIETALKLAGLPLPCTDGKLHPANVVRFGAGWRDTRGDVLCELCEAIDDTSPSAKILKERLCIAWDQWPLRARGTATEWVNFLRLLGVIDGLTPVYYKAVTMPIEEWQKLKRPLGKAIAIEASVGPHWRDALRIGQRSFSYVSGSYSTDDTLFALPLQGTHAKMSGRAKKAYARLIVAALRDLKESHFTTTLRRTSGNSDHVRWTSPLLGFLVEAAWLPTFKGDDLLWVRPHDAWFAPGNELPRFLPRIDRVLRAAIEADTVARGVFAKRLGLRLWDDRLSAPVRLVELGAMLENGIADHEQDSFRREYRNAWEDWNGLDPRPMLDGKMTLAVQTIGRLEPYRPDDGDDGEMVFVGDGNDPTLENLLIALGQPAAFSTALGCGQCPDGARGGWTGQSSACLGRPPAHYLG